jgi:regulator of sigma E protease
MITSVLVFIVVLSVLILVHELGHFITARRAGVWVEEFGIGLPPRIYGKKIGETIYSINLFPFGGFARMHGEDYEESLTKPGRSFIKKGKGVRSFIVLAGVLMNFVLAILAFSVVYAFSGVPKPAGYVKIIDVASAGPSQAAGILPGDKVISVDGKEVPDSNTFIGLVDAKKGEKIAVIVSRFTAGIEERKKITLTPRENPPENEGPLGVTITSTEIYFPPLWQRPFYGVYYGFKDAVFWGKAILFSFASIVGGLFKGAVPKDISGPVGIFAITTEAYKVGILALINFVGILSVNLAILNLVPFPALDGGRLLFIAVEAIFGRKVLPRVEATIHTVGMIILLLLLLAVTVGDLRRLVAAGGIDGFLQSFTK